VKLERLRSSSRSQAQDALITILDVFPPNCVLSKQISNGTSLPLFLDFPEEGKFMVFKDAKLQASCTGEELQFYFKRNQTRDRTSIILNVKFSIRAVKGLRAEPPQNIDGKIGKSKPKPIFDQISPQEFIDRIRTQLMKVSFLDKAPLKTYKSPASVFSKPMLNPQSTVKNNDKLSTFPTASPNVLQSLTASTTTTTTTSKREELDLKNQVIDDLIHHAAKSIKTKESSKKAIPQVAVSPQVNNSFLALINATSRPLTSSSSSSRPLSTPLPPPLPLQPSLNPRPSPLDNAYSRTRIRISDDPHRGSVGLYNLGNTCYMSSTLIGLLYCKPISRTLLCDAVRAGISVTAAGRGRILQVARGDISIEQVLLHGGNLSSSEQTTLPSSASGISLNPFTHNSNLIHPSISERVFALDGQMKLRLSQFTTRTPKLYNLLYLMLLHFLTSTKVPQMLLFQIKKVISNIDDTFANSNQQDAHEFMNTVLNTLVDELEPIGTVLATMPLLDKDKRRSQSLSSSSSSSSSSFAPSSSFSSPFSNGVKLSEKSILGHEVKTLLNRYKVQTDLFKSALYEDDSQIMVNSSHILPLITTTFSSLSSSSASAAADAGAGSAVEGVMGPSIIPPTPHSVDQDLIRKRLSSWALQSGLPMTRSTYFEMCVNLECCVCKFKRAHTETFRDLSLDVLESRFNATVDLASLFTSFFQASNKLEFKCEQKNCTSNHSYVNYRLSTLPRVFILHLKRFIYDDRYRLKKRIDPVSFPILLRLRPEWFSGQVVNPGSTSSAAPITTSSSSSSSSSSSLLSSLTSLSPKPLVAPSIIPPTHLASSVVRTPSSLDILPDADVRLKKLAGDAVSIVAREGLRLAAQLEDREQAKLISRSKITSSRKKEGGEGGGDQLRLSGFSGPKVMNKTLPTQPVMDKNKIASTIIPHSSPPPPPLPPPPPPPPSSSFSSSLMASSVPPLGGTNYIEKRHEMVQGTILKSLNQGSSLSSAAHPQPEKSKRMSRDLEFQQSQRDNVSKRSKSDDVSAEQQLYKNDEDNTCVNIFTEDKSPVAVSRGPLNLITGPSSTEKIAKALQHKSTDREIISGAIRKNMLKGVGKGPGGAPGGETSLAGNDEVSGGLEDECEEIDEQRKLPTTSSTVDLLQSSSSSIDLLRKLDCPSCTFINLVGSTECAICSTHLALLGPSAKTLALAAGFSEADLRQSAHSSFKSAVNLEPTIEDAEEQKAAAAAAANSSGKSPEVTSLEDHEDDVHDVEMATVDQQKDNIAVQPTTAKTKAPVIPAAVGNLFQSELEVRIGTEVKPVSDSGPIWKLRSIVKHHGTNVRFGHYTTFVRGNFDTLGTSSAIDDDRWFTHNDEQVTEVSERQILASETQENAYILMYELIERSEEK
jgi:ubiquitin C-terminal hydrolase